MPLDRQVIFKKAVKYMQGFSIKDASVNTKRSLFGVISAVINSVEHIEAPKNDTLINHRMIIEHLRNIDDKEQRFMGVELDDLDQALNTIFIEGEEILPESDFGSFDHKDLQSYIEICRRIYIADFLKMKDVAFMKKTKPQREISAQKWSFEGFNVLTIKEALTVEDADCAQFVLDHPKDQGNSRELLKQASDILEKKHSMV